MRWGPSGHSSHSPDCSNWERSQKKALQFTAGAHCLLPFLGTAPCPAYSNTGYIISESQQGGEKMTKEGSVTHTPETQLFSHGSPEVKVPLRN